MKTIQKDGKINRVSDSVAFESVKKGWEFCSKSVWKEKVRDVKQPKTNKTNKTKA